MPIFARILDEKYIKTFFMINPIVKTIELPDGRTITLETKLAKQADGSVMLRMGNTMLLATVCAAKMQFPYRFYAPSGRVQRKIFSIRTFSRWLYQKRQKLQIMRF